MFFFLIFIINIDVLYSSHKCGNLLDLHTCVRFRVFYFKDFFYLNQIHPTKMCISGCICTYICVYIHRSLFVIYVYMNVYNYLIFNVWRNAQMLNVIDLVSVNYVNCTSSYICYKICTKVKYYYMKHYITFIVGVSVYCIDTYMISLCITFLLRNTGVMNFQ